MRFEDAEVVIQNGQLAAGIAQETTVEKMKEMTDRMTIAHIRGKANQRARDVGIITTISWPPEHIINIVIRVRTPRFFHNNHKWKK